MAQKLFTVHRNCYATIDIEVLAESEEEAMRKASERFDNILATEYDFTENEVSVIDTKDAPDIDDLIEKVIKRIRRRKDSYLSLSDSIGVTHMQDEYWGGRQCGEHEVVDYVSALYIDDDQLYVEYERDYDSDHEQEDESIDELSEEDQMKILLSVLSKKKKQKKH